MLVQLDARLRAKVDVAGVARGRRGVGPYVGPRADQQPLAAASLGSGGPVAQRLVAVQRALQENVVPRTDVEHWQRNLVRLPHQIDGRPVGAVLFLVKVFVKVGRGLLEPANPVAHGQVLEPGIGQWLREIVRRQHVLVHLGQQVLAARPHQCVAALVDGVRHHPAPLHCAAGVIDPALVKVRRRRHRGHAGQVRGTRPSGEGVLGRSQVGLSGGGHPPVAPRLAGGPLHRVVAVLPLLEQRVVVVAL